jgi:hypothetical protein
LAAVSRLCLLIFFFLSRLPSALRALLHLQSHRSLRFQPAQDFAVAMSNWMRSNVSREQLLRLVEAGQLPPLTATVEWRVPDDEFVSRPQKGFVVSFVAFHERGFSVPAGQFIRGVLFEYGLQLQHLYCDNSIRDNSVLLPKPLHLVIKR